MDNFNNEFELAEMATGDGRMPMNGRIRRMGQRLTRVHIRTAGANKPEFRLMTKNTAPSLTLLVLINESAIHGLDDVDDDTHPLPTISAAHLHKVMVYAVAKYAEGMLEKLKMNKIIRLHANP